MGPLHNKLGLISSVSKQLRLGILLKLSNVDLVSDFKVDATSRSDQKTPKGSRKIHGKLHGKYMEIYRLEINWKDPQTQGKGVGSCHRDRDRSHPTSGLTEVTRRLRDAAQLK